MTQSDTYSFLTQGALYRRPEGTFCLFWEEFNLDELESFGIQSFFDSKIKGYTAKRQILNCSASQLKTALQEFTASHAWKPWAGDDFQAPTVESFRQSFETIQNEIKELRLQKAVPVVFSRSSRAVTPLDRAHWILRLMELPSSVHLYGFWTPESGILGATPETLFHVKGQTLKTMALAGTASRSAGGSQADLLSDPKEQQEHRLVIEDLQEQLRDFGQVTRGETHVVELPTLWHLRTWLEVQLQRPLAGQDLQKLIQRLHPTPALGLAPRARGFSWLRSLPEQQDRHFFGAPLAFRLAKDEVVALVMIRGVQWDSRGAAIGTGCGIVADSQFEKEWSELAAKRNTVLKSLGL